MKCLQIERSARFQTSTELVAYLDGLDADGVPIPTATGEITHGYATISGRGEWGLVNFDERVRRAFLNGDAS